VYCLLRIRQLYPAEDIFEIEGIKVYLKHIGGYPPHYTKSIRQELDDIKPDLFICGHSHIVRIMKDMKRDLMHINPGAAGKQGFHKKRTIVRFKIVSGEIENMQLIELGERV